MIKFEYIPNKVGIFLTIHGFYYLNFPCENVKFFSPALNWLFSKIFKCISNYFNNGAIFPSLKVLLN